MRVLFLEIDTVADWAVASMGPGCVGAFLRRGGHEAGLLRAPYGTSAEALRSRVVAHEPDVLALSLVSKQWPEARRLVAELRPLLELPVVAGGLHPTFSPEQVLASPGFDYVCLGEGEEPMLDLVEALAGGAPTAGIANIWKAGAPRPALRPPFEPIDDFPWMARDLLDERPGVIHMFTQRGCPFDCTYCAARTWADLYEDSGASYGRRRSTGDVLAELRSIRDSGPVVWVSFLDDTFTIHQGWLRDFCARYRTEIGVDFSVLARVETVDQRGIERLAEAGCKMITYGIESGSYRVRKRIMHRPATNARIADVIRWTQEAGILSICGYMLGLPGETRDDLEATLDFARELNAYDLACYVFYPFRGTELHRVCEQEGLLPPDFDDLPANHRRSILNLPDLTPEDIEDTYQRFAALRLETWTARLGEAPDSAHTGAIAAHVEKIATTF